MNQEFFPGMLDSMPVRPSLFLAIFPDAETLRQIVRFGEELKTRHRMTGKLRPPDHLHITLCDFNSNPEPQERIIEAVGEACRSLAVSTRPFEICLDHVMSYRKGSSDNPYVLFDKNDNLELGHFRQSLLTELARQKCLPKGRSGVNPHLTLLYDRQIIPVEPIPQIRWLAGEIVLVRSYSGETRYDRLGPWRFEG